MKKKILVGLVGTMMISSVCLAAAPVTELAKGETVIGLSTSNLDDIDADSLYVEHGIADKFIIGIESTDLEGWSITDFYGKYKLDKNVNLTLGFRDYEDWGNELTFGIEGTTVLAEKTTGYAALKFNSEETEWKLGATYAIAPQINLDLNYTNRDFDGAAINGIGFGVNYKF